MGAQRVDRLVEINCQKNVTGTIKISHGPNAEKVVTLTFNDSFYPRERKTWLRWIQEALEKATDE